MQKQYNGAGGNPTITPDLFNKEKLFKAPPLSPDLLSAIKLISPQYDLTMNHESRMFWEAEQNAACWGEYEGIANFLDEIKSDKKVLEIGPGLGRSVVFFSKKFGWGSDQYDLFEGNGQTTKYTFLGPRFDDSFCGNIEILKTVLEHNQVKNYSIFDAAKLGNTISNLPSTYDIIYSFYAIGYHWSLHHFLDDILSVMHNDSVGFFIVPNEFQASEHLESLPYKLTTIRVGFPQNITHQLLLLRKT